MEKEKGEAMFNPLKTAFAREHRHSSVGSERLICNSSLTNCAAFHYFAQRCRYSAFRSLGIRAVLRRIARFAPKVWPTVEATVKNSAERDSFPFAGALGSPHFDAPALHKWANKTRLRPNWADRNSLTGYCAFPTSAF